MKLCLYDNLIVYVALFTVYRRKKLKTSLKNIKKIISVALTVFMTACIFAGGKKSNNQVIRLAGLKGPTTIGMVKLLDDAENNLTKNKYEFTMAASADELTPRFLKGELDIMAVPANLGAILYNKSNGQAKMLAVNTLGVLYIVEKGGNSVQNLKDLAGKTIYATGKGTTPEFALRYLLSQNGLDLDKDLTVEWKSEPTEIVALMATKENAVAMMPQPFVTVAGTKLKDLRVALNLTEEWDSLKNGSKFITAGLIIRKDFLEKNKKAVKTFLKEYAASAKYVNENIPEAANLVEKYNIVKAPVAQKAIPYCNIVCITGKEMQESVSGYLEVLFKQKPAVTGGKLPAEDFYWSHE